MRKSGSLCLTNSQGRQLTVTLRQFRPGDEEGMIACIRDEYGDSYFRRALYYPSHIRREALSGRSTFLVAQTRAGEIAGMLLLKDFAPREDMCEMASLVFRRKYRGYGLAAPFLQYGMEILLNGDYSAVYSTPVLYHEITQRLLQRLGLKAAGLVLNVFDMSHMTHSYQNGRNTKHSKGIQIKAAGKRDAGTIFLPEEHRDFGERIYEGLGADCCMAKDCREWENMPSSSAVSYVQDITQSSLEISILRVGRDLPDCIGALHQKFPLKGRQTANIFLNISDPCAVWAYRKLSEMGYFFTGLKPLCGEWEYMILHQPGEVEIFLEDYVLSGEFGELAAYIGHSIQKERQ